MKVYKYCKPEHNPLNGSRTIMVNTSRYFRENYAGEGDLINDEQEGIVTAVDEDRNFMERSKTIPDCYMFCTTMEKVDADFARANFDNSYLSCYCINDLEAFHNRLAELISEKMTADNIDPKSLAKFEERMKGLGINYSGAMTLFDKKGPVGYTKGSIGVKVKSIWDATSLTEAGHFYKPPIYASQKEYRFLYFLGVAEYVPGKNIYFDVAPQGLILQFNDILDFVGPCQ